MRGPGAGTANSSSKDSRAAAAQPVYGSSASSSPDIVSRTQRHVRHVARQQAPHRGHVDPDVLGIQQVAVVRGGQRATPTRHQPEPATQRAHVALDGGDVARRRPPVPEPLGEQVLGDRRPQVQREHLEHLTRLAAAESGADEPAAVATDDGWSE
jgi:hypothetical protein